MSRAEDRPLRVYISSTFVDNADRQKIVEDALLTVGLVPVGLERHTASSQPTIAHHEQQVHGCDWFVGIVAYRYGEIPPGQPKGQERSLIEIEYDAAKAKGMPRLMFVLDESQDINPHRDFDPGPDRWEKQAKLDQFKQRFRADQAAAMFQETNLGTRVLKAIFQERIRQAENVAERAAEAQGTEQAVGGMAPKVEGIERAVDGTAPTTHSPSRADHPVGVASAEHAADSTTSSMSSSAPNLAHSAAVAPKKHAAGNKPPTSSSSPHGDRPNDGSDRGKGDLIAGRAVEELARVFYDPELATFLAIEAGVPRERLRAFTTSILFWTHLIDEIHSGLLAGGAGPIFETAARMYPGNSIFVEAQQACSRTQTDRAMRLDDASADRSVGETTERAVGETAGGTASTLPMQVSKTELQRYLAKAETLHDRISLIGFETTIRLKIKLDDLYVPLHAMIDRGLRGRDCLNALDARLVPGRPTQPQSAEIPMIDAFARARALGRRGVLLLGDPGSGKTTHLEKVLLQVIREGPESIGLPEGTVPVFLPLRNLRDRSKGLPGFIQQELDNPLLDVAKDFGYRLCRRGKLLYLLDGLDEVADAQERTEVARWIEEALLHGPDCYFLVSCRYAGYTKDVELDADFLELHLRPLSDDQMKAFVTNWYTIVEHEVLVDPTQAAQEAERRSSDLLRTLSQTDFTAVARVYELTRNPLLLTAICLVHRDRGRLPKARAQLYEDSIGVLLERWRRKLPGALHSSETIQVLQPVARWMHGVSGRTRASAAELVAPVKAGLSTLRHVGMSADRFLRMIRDESGLLTGWGVDEYGFMHLGFQEYLAAQHLRNAAVGQPRELWELAERFDDSWWQEVILLMLAQRNPSVFEHFMRAVVRQPEFHGWHESEMMQLCLNEAAVPSAVPFVELLGIAAGEGDPDELGQRQRAAAQILARAMPEHMERLAPMLRKHPAPVVRAWWRDTERQSRSGEDVIEAPQGGVELVFIPGGTFMMGSPESEVGRELYPDSWIEEYGGHLESPQHEVELSDFYIARTPVTNAQYAKFLKANPGVAEPQYWGDRKYNQPDQPVVGVSWHDAQAYCAWAGLVLPTEAQWEYGCRARTKTRFHSGDSEQDLDRVAWYGESLTGVQPHGVGTKEPNDFGLYDMHGNVWEWCRDNYGAYQTSPRGEDGLRHKPESGAGRVVRGGAFVDTAGLVRSAFRFWYEPDFHYYWLGFRPAMRPREVVESNG